MPVSSYYGGRGKEVMSDMKNRYGSKKGEQVFHATANKKDQNPDEDKKSRKRKGASKGLKKAGNPHGYYK